MIVNNAGYALFGAVEELTEQQLRDALETNVFGALRVIQAALPHLRQQGAGHIIQMSSAAGLFAMPLASGHHVCKWAPEALNDSLAQEVAGFGVKVTVVEPAGFATRRGGELPDALTDGVQARANSIYTDFRQRIAEFRENMPAGRVGHRHGNGMRTRRQDRPLRDRSEHAGRRSGRSVGSPSPTEIRENRSMSRHSAWSPRAGPGT